MIKTFLLFILILLIIHSDAQQPAIIPQPQHISMGKGTANINAATVIVVKDPSFQTSADFLNSFLQRFYGFALKQSTKARNTNCITLGQTNVTNPNSEAYLFTANNSGIHISAANQKGIFYGVQTLIQLLPKQKQSSLSIPQLIIEDAPRFAYRGLHLDVCRHFFPVEFIKQYIDYIALFKLNTFHWHLTDDQGWCIEIKKYPLLTQVGGQRNGTITGHSPGTGNDNTPVSGFYTQEQIKEVVQYAADRMITVIPEIEMPGHASAAIAAYPFLSCFPNEATNMGPHPSTASQQQQANGRLKLVQETWGVFPDVFCPSDSTFHFLEDVLDEVIQLFPSKYIHIGGDECPKDAWKRSDFCQQLIKAQGLKDEHELQSYFIRRIETYLNSKGRNIIGWDEILEGGLAPNATVMSWRGEAGGIAAARQQHEVIMTPGTYCYFDHSELKPADSLTIGGYLPLETVYNYNPVSDSLTAAQQHFIRGAQANLWTEYISNTSKLEYMLFPRLAALSEVLWSPLAEKKVDDFNKRLPALQQMLDMIGTNYNAKSFK